MLSILPVSQLSAERRQEVAAMLFAHLTATEREQRVEQLRTALIKRELDEATILTAWLGECVLGVLVVELIPGSSAVLWAVRSRPGSERTTCEDALFSHAIQMLQSRGVKLAQSFLPPAEEAAANALLRNGFQRIASVWHMRCDLPGGADDSVDVVQMQPFDKIDATVFQETLLRTFDETLDCPELNHLRTSDEIFAGHRAGAPDASRWWLIEVGDKPVGVLILADAPFPDFWDLAYLGILPEARRRGLAREALAFAKRQAVAVGQKGMTLMVDERNRPAIDLYQQHGFHFVATRDVYLRY